MFLCIDIGNSTIGFGIFLDANKSKKPSVWKIPTHPKKSKSYYKKIIADLIKKKSGIQHSVKDLDSIISSVVPSLDQIIIEAAADICGKRPLILGSKLDCGIALNVHHPGKIGPDRIANAVAGLYYFKKQFAVVDFGTATTITVIGKYKDLLGGTILPGLGIMQRSLHSEAAMLPSVRLLKPKAALGENTSSSIRSGIIYGTAGAVENIIRNMEKELSFRLKLVLTGGYSNLMSHYIKKEHILMPYLTFDGMRLIYLKNSQRTKYI